MKRKTFGVVFILLCLCLNTCIFAEERRIDIPEYSITFDLPAEYYVFTGDENQVREEVARLADYMGVTDEETIEEWVQIFHKNITETNNIINIADEGLLLQMRVATEDLSKDLGDYSFFDLTDQDAKDMAEAFASVLYGEDSAGECTYERMVNANDITLVRIRVNEEASHLNNGILMSNEFYLSMLDGMVYMFCTIDEQGTMDLESMRNFTDGLIDRAAFDQEAIAAIQNNRNAKSADGAAPEEPAVSAEEVQASETAAGGTGNAPQERNDLYQTYSNGEIIISSIGAFGAVLFGLIMFIICTIIDKTKRKNEEESVSAGFEAAGNTWNDSGDPYSVTDQIEERPAPKMKWYKFIVNFSLWATMWLNAADAVLMVMRSLRPGLSTDEKAIYVFFALAYAGIVLFAFIVRSRLKNFKANGPKLFMIFLICVLLLSCAEALFEEGGEIVQSTSSFVTGNIIYILYNRRYFKERAELFCR